MIRVLIVDDSAFARKVIREVLSASPLIEVVGIARDGLDALEKIRDLSPDVITLDLVMPHLDGIGLLHALPHENAPRVVVVTLSGADSDLGVEALQNGAFDLVQKPTALATDRLYGLATELVAKVTLAAAARPGSRSRYARHTSRPPPSRPHATRLVAIGTSTGGPQALTRILPALPANFPAPVTVVVHIPPGYTETLAKRLDTASAVSVCEAREGLEIGPGQVAIARAGVHLRLSRRGNMAVMHLDLEPATSLHRPSVDIMFESAAAAFGSELLAVVLTGMGDDGLIGARAVREQGGRILTESESSCIVYGMPRRVHEAGLADAEAPLAAMVETMLRWV